MNWCKIQGKPVYSCDHYDCNKKDNDPRASQGMHYCYEAKCYVYGCDHPWCNQ